jgi:hypothetical protein
MWCKYCVYVNVNEKKIPVEWGEGEIKENGGGIKENGGGIKENGRGNELKYDIIDIKK